MKQGGFYSASQARRSLKHFLFGKAASAIAGLVWLVWLVRVVPAGEYGIYVALLAILEIFYLVSGFGLSTMAQRYLAEFRIKAPRRQFVRFVSSLMLQRLGFAAGLALLFGLAMPHVLGWWNLPLAPALRWWFCAWLVSGSVTRYLDEVFPALLLQAASQVFALVTNLSRLGGVWLLSSQGLSVDHRMLVWVELGISVAIATAGISWLARYLRRHPGHESGEYHENPMMRRVAWRFYLVQILGQTWSGHAAKLVVTRVAGVTQTAKFGFALSVVEMLRNYLPAYLLANWVRPLMVARYLESRNVEPVTHMANAVFKLSLISLMPFAAYFATHGEAFARWLSKGRYGEDAASMLTWLVIWAALQCMHIVIGMVTATLERANANLWATAFGGVSLPVAVLMSPLLGAVAVPAMMCAAELIWVAVVVGWLARQGVPFRVDLKGSAKVMVCAAAAAAVLAAVPGASGPWVLWPLVLACVVVLGGAAVLKPLTPGERALFAQVVPARWIVW